MAERPIWRGHLRLALVSCPVALYAAKAASSNLHFHLINPETGNRVRMITQDAETGEELSRRDLAKGYEFKKDNYLILTDDDFEAARIESSETMVIDKFVATDAIDPIYFENSYYMVPDGDAGRDVFVVLRDAIRQSGKIALSRVVIARRERAVALLPMEHGLVVHTLHEAKDLHDARVLFDQVPSSKPDPEMVKLARQLIERQAGAFDPADMDDRYEARLRDVIQAKLKGEGIEPEAEPAEDRGNVIDLMAALKLSLEGGDSAAPSRKQTAPRNSQPAKAETRAKTAASKTGGAKTGSTSKVAPPSKPTARRRKAS
jgi:DNA end-binding protein Ku